MVPSVDPPSTTMIWVKSARSIWGRMARTPSTSFRVRASRVAVGRPPAGPQTGGFDTTSEVADTDYRRDNVQSIPLPSGEEYVMNGTKDRGFTLIELLIVVAIIS